MQRDLYKFFGKESYKQLVIVASWYLFVKLRKIEIKDTVVNTVEFYLNRIWHFFIFYVFVRSKIVEILRDFSQGIYLICNHLCLFICHIHKIRIINQRMLNSWDLRKTNFQFSSIIYIDHFRDIWSIICCARSLSWPFINTTLNA